MENPELSIKLQRLIARERLLYGRSPKFIIRVININRESLRESPLLEDEKKEKWRSKCAHTEGFTFSFLGLSFLLS
jgi:hypothetical protein